MQLTGKQVAATSSIARLYHSVALMLKDGTVLVTGSNPNEMPILLDHVDLNSPLGAFPTEFRMERFTPSYLMGNPIRPVIISSPVTLKPAQEFEILLEALYPRKSIKQTKVILYHGGFVTHALHMGQRMIELSHEMYFDKQHGLDGLVNVTMPPSHGIVPPGPYWLFALVNGVPSEGVGAMVE